MFRRNQKLEALLDELNGLLGPVGERVAASYRILKYPAVFVVGAPRSGTTLMTQWLAATGCFAYPTNLVSRFYAAPYIGAKIQQLLTDPAYNFNDELGDFDREFSFDSNLAKTKGALAPNEFWYFWRRFIPNVEPRFLTEEEELQVNGAGFAAELAAFEGVFDKPVAMKGIILQYNLAKLSSILDKAIFIHTKRHPFYNIQSLLEARVKYYGTRDTWYSAKPKEFEALQHLDPFRQVAGQIHHTVRAIDIAFETLDPARCLTVAYEDLCRAPGRTYARLVQKLSEQGCAIAPDYAGPARFEHTNAVRVSEGDVDAIRDAYAEVSGETAAP